MRYALFACQFCNLTQCHTLLLSHKEVTANWELCLHLSVPSLRQKWQSWGQLPSCRLRDGAQSPGALLGQEPLGSVLRGKDAPREAAKEMALSSGTSSQPGWHRGLTQHSFGEIMAEPKLSVLTDCHQLTVLLNTSKGGSLCPKGVTQNFTIPACYHATSSKLTFRKKLHFKDI